MANLIRNRVTERDIRQWFDENGYHGGSAKLENIELHAIKRPGWKQLFRFSGSVRPERPETGSEEESPEQPKRSPVWGVVLDDERKPAAQRTQVFLFDSEVDQQEQLANLSVDMITANKSEQRVFGVWSLVGIALFCAVMLFLVAMVKNQYE